MDSNKGMAINKKMKIGNLQEFNSEEYEKYIKSIKKENKINYQRKTINKIKKIYYNSKSTNRTDKKDNNRKIIKKFEINHTRENISHSKEDIDYCDGYDVNVYDAYACHQ